MTPDQLREKGNRWRELGQYDLANIYNQHAAALEEIERLKAELENEVAIVNRIWAIYGNPDYETLNGRTIYDLINADRERAENAERRAERLKGHAEAMARTIFMNSDRADVASALAYEKDFPSAS